MPNGSVSIKISSESVAKTVDFQYDTQAKGYGLTKIAACSEDCSQKIFIFGLNKCITIKFLQMEEVDQKSQIDKQQHDLKNAITLALEVKMAFELYSYRITSAEMFIERVNNLVKLLSDEN